MQHKLFQNFWSLCIFSSMVVQLKKALSGACCCPQGPGWNWSSDLYFMFADQIEMTFVVPFAGKMMLACPQTSHKGNCVGKLIDAHVCTCVLYLHYLLYYIGRVGRPLPCRVRSLAGHETIKSILCWFAGWRSHGNYQFVLFCPGSPPCHGVFVLHMCC